MSQKCPSRIDRIHFMAPDRKQRREALYNELSLVVLQHYRNLPASDRKRVLALIGHKCIEQEKELLKYGTE